MSLIAIALQGLQEIVATEMRRMAREVQMAKLNGHDENAQLVVPDNIAMVPAPIAYAQASQSPSAAPTRVDRVLAAAQHEWDLDVAEPVGTKSNGAARIDLYIRGPLGLGWSTAELGPNARPGIAYTKNQMFQWCGAFAAHTYGSAGLRPQIRKKHLASTYRLFSWARGNARWVEPNPASIQPGDIVVVGPDGSPHGEHVVICIEVHPDHIVTIEGNASGPGPRGDKREGVIKRKRSFRQPGGSDREYCVVFGVRPLDADYIGA